MRATVFVFVRDRARGERQTPPSRRRPVQRQRRQTGVPVAVPQRQQRLEIGLHKGAQRVRVHGAVAEEKATKAEAEERRRGRWCRQEVATMSEDQDDAAAIILLCIMYTAAATVEHGVFRESYL